MQPYYLVNKVNTLEKRKKKNKEKEKGK